MRLVSRAGLPKCKRHSHKKRSARLGLVSGFCVCRRRCRENFVNARSIKKVRAVRKQLADLCKTHGICLASCGEDMTPLHRCAVVMS